VQKPRPARIFLRKTMTPSPPPAMLQSTSIGGTIDRVRLAYEAAGLAEAAFEARALVNGLLSGDDPDRSFSSDISLMQAAATTGRDAATLMALIQSGVSQRLQGKPLDRVLARRGFWTLDLELGPATLSPRPDTETIVTAALAILRARNLAAPTILDLGTGSGAILLALLSKWPSATGLGIDLEPDAITIAQRNATRTTLAPRATFQTGNWCAGLTVCFDLIVSNPPYIPSGDIVALAREVREHDPLLALDGGNDGLVAYRIIAAEAREHLAEGGAVVLEIGAGQADDVTHIFTKSGFTAGQRHRDLGGHERALVFF
jgi:release factor glutamine methyltransferase